MHFCREYYYYVQCSIYLGNKCDKARSPHSKPKLSATADPIYAIFRSKCCSFHSQRVPWMLWTLDKFINRRQIKPTVADLNLLESSGTRSLSHFWFVSHCEQTIGMESRLPKWLAINSGFMLTCAFIRWLSESSFLSCQVSPLQLITFFWSWTHFVLIGN